MFTDRDLALWQKSLSGKGITFEIERNDLEGLFERLKAAEAVVDEAESVAHSIAFTTGTKTNSEMPKWLVARVKAMDEALQNWVKVAGKYI